MLRTDAVTVRFGDRAAVDDVSLTVAAGESLVLLGPSGAGKSTLLRAMVGLQPVDSGRVFVADVDVTGRRPDQRNIGMMFQSATLFPHRTVGANVDFGLRMAGVERVERRRRVDDLLSMVGLDGAADRAVATLSGGEAQRVALARSLAPEPSVLLLDEPFTALDRRRRDELRDEVAALLRARGVAAVHVTHDHDDAYALADTVAVMTEGRVVQHGTPDDLWRRPADRWVAEFLGLDDIVTLDGRAVLVGSVRADPDGDWVGVVTERRRSRTGSAVRVRIDSSRVHGAVTVVADAGAMPELGAQLRLTAPADALHPLD